MRLKGMLLPLPFPSTSARPGCGRGFSHHLEFPREKHLDTVQQRLLIPNSLPPPSPVRKPGSGTATANTAVSWSWELLTGIPATLGLQQQRKKHAKYQHIRIKHKIICLFSYFLSRFSLNHAFKYEF